MISSVLLVDVLDNLFYLPFTDHKQAVNLILFNNYVELKVNL